jgi:hypothetical protein
MGVNDRGDRVCSVMESIDEFKTQSQSECKEEEKTAADGYRLAEKLHATP